MASKIPESCTKSSYIFFFLTSLPCVNSNRSHICIFLLLQAVLIPDVIDVEAPEYLATNLLVLLYMEPDPGCSRCFRAALPVHGRYHRPAEESEEALVVLKSPEVLVCCCDSEILVKCSFGEKGIIVGNPELRIWFCICLPEMEVSVVM